MHRDNWYYLSSMKTLKLLRMLSGKSQFELGVETRIPSYRLSRLENGWVEPTEEELHRLAVALGTTPDRIRGEVSKQLLEGVIQ